MPWAFVNVDGTIKQVVHKPSPVMRLEEGERLVKYNPPEFDVETETMSVDEPVPEGAEHATFTITPKDPAIVLAAQKARINAAVQTHLDAVAQSQGYDSIISAVSYAGSTHPVYGPEGVALSAWRDACWDYTFQVYADVESQSRVMPEPDVLVGELPVYST